MPAYALHALTLIAALGAGLMSGLYFGFSVAVMIALGRLPPTGGIVAMQSINRAILNPPFSAEALLAGMRSLGALDDLIGPYQAGGAFAMRAWAEANAETVERYITGYLKSLDWLRDSANEQAALDLLRRRLDLSAPVAHATLRQLCDPSRGFTMDARFNEVGFARVLAVRTETEGADPSVADPSAYVNLSFYNRVARNRR